jgi:hypothetical protein
VTVRRGLYRATLAAAILTVAITGGLVTDGGPRRTVTDQALSALLLATLPLAACLAVWGAGSSEDPLLAFGANRRRSVVWQSAPFLWGLPLVISLLAALVLVWTRGVTDARLVDDLASTLPVAIMAAVATVAAFLAVGQWFGRVGLVVLLLVCLTLGQADLLAVAALPGGHVRHLLGVGMVLPFDPGWSMAALWGFSLFGFGAWLLRVPP